MLNIKTQIINIILVEHVYICHILHGQEDYRHCREYRGEIRVWGFIAQTYQECLTSKLVI